MNTHKSPYHGCCCTRLLNFEASRLFAMLAMLVSGTRFSALTGLSGCWGYDGDTDDVVTCALGDASERCRLLLDEILEGIREPIPPPGKLSRRAVVGRGAKERLRQTPRGTLCRRPSGGAGGASPGDGIGRSRLPESSSVHCVGERERWVVVVIGLAVRGVGWFFGARLFGGARDIDSKGNVCVVWLGVFLDCRGLDFVGLG